MRTLTLLFLFLSAVHSPATDAILLRDAALDGDAGAAYELGRLYQERKLYSHAMRWYRIAASADHRGAHLALGHMILRGEGCPPDRKEAALSLSLAAEENPDAKADLLALEKTLTPEKIADIHFSLFNYYTRGNYYPNKAPAKAIPRLRRAADGGHAEAQRILGVFFMIGRDMEKNEEEGFRWSLKAASQDFPAALYDVALSYKTGRGVEKDEVESLNWIRKAADLGSSTAQSVLGTAYEKGESVPKDAAEAVKWYRLAGGQGSINSAVALARCFRFGYGVQKDPVQAAMWANIAVQRLGSKRHQPFLDSILKGLTPDQIAESQRLAASWRKQPSGSGEKKATGADLSEALIVPDAPDLGEPEIVVPMAVTKDGNGMITVSQFRNPDPIEVKDHPWVDALESWDLQTMTRIHRSGITGISHEKGAPNRNGGLTGPIAFSPNGTLLLAGTDGKGIDVFRSPNFEKIGTLIPSVNRVIGRLGVPCAAFNEAGDRIFTALGPTYPEQGSGGQIWNSTGLTLEKRFDLKSNGAICLSPDETLLLTVEYQNRVHLWDVRTAALVAEFHPQRGILDAAAFHPSGERIAFAGESGAAQLEIVRSGGKFQLRPGAGARLNGIPTGGGGIRSIAYSPDGRLLATADAYDRMLRVFDAETGLTIGAASQTGLGPVLFTLDGKAIWMAGERAPHRLPLTRLKN